MGHSLVGIHLKHPSQDDVLKSMKGIVNRQAIVGPALDGWVPVYDESCEPLVLDEAERIAKRISAQLGTEAVVLGVYDGSYLGFAHVVHGKSAILYVTPEDDGSESARVGPDPWLASILNETSDADQLVLKIASHFGIPAQRASLSFSYFGDGTAKETLGTAQARQFRYVRRKNYLRDSRRLVDAVCDGELETVREMISSGISVNSTGSYAVRIIEIAAVREQTEVVKYLVEQGAEVTHDTFEAVLGVMGGTKPNRALVDYFRTRPIAIPEELLERAERKHGKDAVGYG
jgi:hypothetical protein